MLFGGSRPCGECGLSTVVADLDERDRCTICRLTDHRAALLGPPPTVVRDPHGVYVDASYRDGRAGLAVVGALGTHTRVVAATGSVAAEVAALRWGVELARRYRSPPVRFYTDSQAAAIAAAGWPEHVVQIPRRRNAEADHAARAARMDCGRAA